VHEVAGYFDPNEDRELIRQRRIRGAEADQEMGITKKPQWWLKLREDNKSISVHDRITHNVGETKQATIRNLERSIEMGNMPVNNKTDTCKSMGETGDVRVEAGLLFPTRDRHVETQERFTDRPESRTEFSMNRNETVQELGAGEWSNINHNTGNGGILGVKLQVVRSMLDV
jgi:hypothetical protein